MSRPSREDLLAVLRTIRKQADRGFAVCRQAPSQVVCSETWRTIGAAEVLFELIQQACLRVGVEGNAVEAGR